jgi:hypothetical protein
MARNPKTARAELAKRVYQKPAWEKQDLFEKFATPNQNKKDSAGCSYCTDAKPQSQRK